MVKNIGMRQLFDIVPEGVLEELAKELGVDKPNQKLTGSIMYKTLIYSTLSSHRLSLRVMETMYNSALFQAIFGTGNTTSHSSLADRLGKLNPVFFERIFNYLSDKFNTEYASSESKKIVRFDSTIVGTSALLFPQGMNYSGLTKVRHLKITIGQKGCIPTSVQFYTEPENASEDIALKKAIRAECVEDGEFVLFDRGLTAAPTFASFSDEGRIFITRVKENRRFNVVETIYESNDTSILTTKTLAILSEQKVQLWNTATKKFFPHYFRLIRATQLSNGKAILFLTNDFTCSVAAITELYSRRWEIEVFFRFIKQELNFKHFLARNLNGLKCFLYAVLIASILFLIYKISHNKTGYKIAKMQFYDAIQAEVWCDLAYCCGDHQQKLRTFLGFT